MGTYIPPQPVQPFQFQQQGQAQDQSQTGGFVLNDNSNTETTSKSKSENQNNLSGSLSNVAIQNNNDDYFQYERGVRIPTTSLNLSGWASEHDHGVQVSLSIPIGGKAKKLAKAQIQKRTEEIQINNVARQLSTCANVEAANYQITDYDALGLGACKYMSKLAKADTSIQEYQKALKDQQLLIQKLLIRIDNMQTENGNPFKSPG